MKSTLCAIAVLALLASGGAIACRLHETDQLEIRTHAGVKSRIAQQDPAEAANVPYRGETAEQIAGRYETLIFPTAPETRDPMLQREFRRILQQDRERQGPLAKTLTEAYWTQAVRTARSWADLEKQRESYLAALPAFPFDPPPTPVNELEPAFKSIPLEKSLALGLDRAVGMALLDWAQKRGGAVPQTLLDSIAAAACAEGPARDILTTYYGHLLSQQADVPDEARWSAVEPEPVRQRAKDLYFEAVLDDLQRREIFSESQSDGGSSVPPVDSGRFARVIAWYLEPGSAGRQYGWEDSGWSQLQALASRYPEATIAATEAAQAGKKRDDLLAILIETMAGDYPEKAPHWLEGVQGEWMKTHAANFLNGDPKEWPHIHPSEEKAGDAERR